MKRSIRSKQPPKRHSEFRSDARPLLGLFGVSTIALIESDNEDQSSLPAHARVPALPDFYDGSGKTGALSQQIQYLYDGSQTRLFYESNNPLELSSYEFNGRLLAASDILNGSDDLDFDPTDENQTQTENKDSQAPEVADGGDQAEVPPEIAECTAEAPVYGGDTTECLPEGHEGTWADGYSGLLVNTGSISSLFSSSAMNHFSVSASSGSSGRSTPQIPSIVYATPGKVIDGYVEGATVFADLNGDGVFNTGEPSAITDASGGYTLESTVDLTNVTVISTGGIDITTGAAVDYLIAPAGVTFITPISTLAHYAETSGNDSATLLSDLGFSEDYLAIDPVALLNSTDPATVAAAENFLVAGASVLTSVGAMCSLVASSTGASQSEVAASLFEQLGKMSASDLAKLTDRSDSTSDATSVLKSVLVNTLADRGVAGIPDDVIDKAATSVGQVVNELRQSTDLTSAQAISSVGQVLLSDEFKLIGAEIKSPTGEDISVWIDKIRSDYDVSSDNYKSLKEAQSIAVEARTASSNGAELVADVYQVLIDDTGSARLSSNASPLVNDTFSYGQQVELVSVNPLLKANEKISVSFDSQTGQLSFQFLDGFDRIDASSLNDPLDFGDPEALATFFTEATKAYGDYYFKYQVNVDGQPLSGLITLQVAPEVTIDLKPSASVIEDTTFKLNDLIAERTFGPGDSLTITGLPVGSSVSALVGSNDSLGVANLDLVASADGIVIPNEWLLPWRFDDVTISLPTDHHGEFVANTILTAQYESASYRSEDSITVQVTPVGDGLNGLSGIALSRLLEAARDSDPVKTEGAAFSLFKQTTDLVNYLDSAKSDSAESIAVAIGLPSGASIVGLDVMSSAPVSDSLDWFVVSGSKDALTAKLNALNVISSRYAVDPKIIVGTGETDGSYSWATSVSVPLDLKLDLIKPVIESQLSDLSSTDTEFDGQFALSISDLVVSQNQHQDFALIGNDQVLEFFVVVPGEFNVLRQPGLINWSKTNTANEYSVTGSVKAALDGRIADLVLSPKSGYFTDPNGVPVQVSVETYSFGDEASRTQYGTLSGPVFAIKVAPDLDSGSVNTEIALIALTESQNDAADQWSSLSDYLSVNAPDISGATNTLVLTLSDGLASPSLMIRDSQTGLAVKSTQVDGDHVFEIPITNASFANLEVMSSPFVSLDGAELESFVRTEVSAWAFESASESSVFKLAIDPVASEIKTSPIINTAYTGTEDTAFALSDLVTQTAVLSDSSETLVYQIELPKQLYLFNTSTSLLSGGRLSSDGSSRTFEIEQSELANYQVMPKASFAGDNLAFSVTPIAVESDGSRNTDHQPIYGTISISAVSSAPVVVVPGNTVSGLINTTVTSLSAPVSVTKTDLDETLAVSLEVRSEGTLVNDVVLTINNGSVVTLPDPNADGIFEVESQYISFLSTLRVSSSSDYRGTERLSISVRASSQDGSAPAESPALLPTFDIEIYQQLSSPTVRAQQLKKQDQKYLDIDIDLVNPPVGFTVNEVTLLVTGIDSASYFVDELGTPIGANLGGGVWLFNGSDVIDSSWGAQIEIRGTKASNSVVVKAILTDSVGGTSASGSSSSVSIDPVDPVVVVFGETPNIVEPADGVAFNFDYHSGLETALGWMSGDSGSGLSPTGTAFLVNGNVVTGYSDLIPSIDALLGDNGAIDLVGQGYSLWFDQASSGDYGVVDQTELVSLDSLFTEFIVQPSMPDPVDGATVDLIDKSTVTYKTQSGITISGDIKLFGTQIEHVYQNNALSDTSFPESARPIASITPLSSQVNEDVPFDFVVSYQSAVIPPEVSNPVVLDFVKVFGVPANAILESSQSSQNAVFVEASNGDPAFWIVEIASDQDANNSNTQNILTMRYVEPHQTGSVTLSVEPIVSIADIGLSLSGSISGVRTTAGSVNVNPQPETDISLYRVNDQSIDVEESGVIDFLKFGLKVQSPDIAESTFIDFKMYDLVSKQYIDLNTFASDNALSIKSGYVRATQSEFDSLSFNLPQFLTHNLELHARAVSQHGNVFEDTDQFAIPVTINSIANGVGSVSASLVGQDGSPVTSISEGETVEVNVASSTLDQSESVLYRVLIGGDQSAFDAIQSLGGLSATDTDGHYRVFEFDEDVFSNGPLALSLDEYFDGSIELKVSAASVDLASGSVSNYTDATPQNLTVLQDPGNIKNIKELDINDPIEKLLSVQGDLANVEQFNGLVTGTLSSDGESITFDSPSAFTAVELNPLTKSKIVVDGIDNTNQSVGEIDFGSVSRSFEWSIESNGQSISELVGTEGGSLSFEIRVVSYDTDEDFELVSQSSAVAISKTVVINTDTKEYTFTCSLNPIPKPSALSAFDDLKLVVHEGSSIPLAIPSIPITINPIANGINGLPILTVSASSSDLSDIDFREGKPLWIKSTANLVDSDEILSYRVEIGGSAEAVQAVQSFNGIASTSVSGDGLSKLFDVSADLLLNPVKLVLDPNFYGDLTIDVYASSYEPSTGEESAPVHVGQTISVIPVADGLSSFEAGVSSRQDVIETEFLEGQSVWIHSTAELNDGSEDLLYTISVGQSEKESAAVLTLNGHEPNESLSSETQKVFNGIRFDENSFPLELKLDNHFDGDLSIKIDAFSQVGSEVSTVESITETISVGQVFASPELKVFVDDQLQTEISPIAGYAYSFDVQIVSADSDETFEVSSSSSLLTVSAKQGSPNTYTIATDAYPGDLNLFDTLSIQQTESGQTRSLLFKIFENDLTVSPQFLEATTPEFDPSLSDPIRLVVDSDTFELSALNLFVSNRADTGANEQLEYELADAVGTPSNLLLIDAEKLILGVNGSELASANDTGRKTYRLSTSNGVPIQPVTMSVLAGLFADFAYAYGSENQLPELVWTATNTEPVTNDVESSSVSILVTPEIRAEAIVVDGSSDVALKFFGGIQGETITAANNSSVMGGSNVIVKASDLSGFQSSLNQTNQASINYSLDDFGDTTGIATVDVRTIPHVSQWASQSASSDTDVLSLFGDGFVGSFSMPANVNEDNETVFLDFDFGRAGQDVGILNEFGVSSSLGVLSQDMLSGNRDLDSVTNIFGTQYSDFMVAPSDSSGSIMYGAGGINTLRGSIGDDVMVFGTEADLMHGNLGNDVFQISVDSQMSQESSSSMENLLDRFLGGDSGPLFEQISDFHDKSGISSDASVRFKGVVDDFAFGRSVGAERDLLIFSDGNRADPSSQLFATKDLTWGGHDDLVYVMARQFDSDSGGYETDAFVSALLIPEYGVNDIDLTDLEASGIYAA